ncbi:hypothetical protein IGS68_20275 [Skermanella sp. TT6]|uniref:Uncharacterized protein n=1 Tax=Skermanella cutis TaxID=2775420 RepID=A0ABX7B3Z8_9PROT|nr:hypothetical protein [Skermanella sp. TT6]QQP88364.1 hypothetical protein IGS68_20275 [Skermanella sp. TT6]
MGKISPFHGRTRGIGNNRPRRVIDSERPFNEALLQEILMENNMNHVIVLSSIAIAILLLLVLTA